MKLQLKIAPIASRMAFLISAAFLKQHVVGPGQCMNVPTILVTGELDHGSARAFIILILQVIFLYAHIPQEHDTKNLFRAIIHRVQLQAQGTELVKGLLGNIHSGLHLLHKPGRSLLIRSH